MENRRQHFRYAFTPKAYWKATFRAFNGTASFSAEIVNLSIGGICVRLEPELAVKEGFWTVTLTLSTQAAPLSIPVERVHPNTGEPGSSGFRFLPLPNAVEQEEQDRLIWRFIIEEQRRDRRQAARSA